jgi:pSer/pThr/pTyr-binding forkhead associated (FHA) protein
MVSRKHAEFRLGEGHVTVLDANSRFGTFVNGQQISAPVKCEWAPRFSLARGGRSCELSA